ncbi:MAG: hypothetical protein HW397_473 [Dehalococcoidia bacterium]|nr:hypothetical protein [Dehalococcoidia bacterium]
MLITLGNLSALFFVLLRDLLEGKLALESFHESRWFTASLLMAGAISVYYGFVLREDRRLMALDAPAQPALQGSILKKRVIAMSGPEAREAVTRLEAALGYPVTWWRTLDAAAGAPALLEAELPALAERIAQAPGTRIVLVLDAGGVKVLPYQPE